MNLEKIRTLFPILEQEVYGKPLAYLDNAATTQKPINMIYSIQEFYANYNANVNRGAHYLGEMATKLLEESRIKIAKFINAKRVEECIFTKSATEAINLVANSFCAKFLKPGDNIVLSQMEHHANIVPWQIQAAKIGFEIRYLPLLDSGELDLSNIKDIITDKTKLVSVMHISNTLGTINPITEIIKQAKLVNAKTLIDGTQALAHFRVNVQELDCDFYVLSAHKMYGPLGVGILYGKYSLLDSMPPFLGGGEMISEVYLDRFVCNNLPYKFEAGTLAIADIYGFGVAIDFLNTLDYTAIHKYEMQIHDATLQALNQFDAIKIIGNAKHKAPIISFTYANVHPHDVGTILDREGVAVRTGHHCTMPIMQYYKIPATTRISIAMYNNKADIEALINGLSKVQQIFAKRL